MIGQLRGILLAKQPPQLLLDVGGVGYEIEASMNTFYKLPELNQPLTLLTHFVVREDAQLLYGFHDKHERELFRTLIKVSGVGPKLAITLLSSITPDAFVQCVFANDTATLVRLPGIGKKTAERLVVELKDKLKDWNVSTGNAVANDNSNVIVRRSATQDAVSALIALGYKPQEASRAVSAVETEESTSEQLIRDALKQIAS